MNPSAAQKSLDQLRSPPRRIVTCRRGGSPAGAQAGRKPDPLRGQSADAFGGAGGAYCGLDPGIRFYHPVLIDGEDGIIAGHGRVLAARKLGLEQVPVIELVHLSASQKQAYLLADNKLAERAGWDRDLLALEVGDLSELGVDLSSLGFEAGEIDALLHGSAPDPREEETPEPPEQPASRPGDLWLLGPHRVLCGDATDAAAVARLLAGAAPHLMVTDPPYGVSYDPAWRNRAQELRPGAPARC